MSQARRSNTQSAAAIMLQDPVTTEHFAAHKVVSEVPKQHIFNHDMVYILFNGQ